MRRWVHLVFPPEPKCLEICVERKDDAQAVLRLAGDEELAERQFNDHASVKTCHLRDHKKPSPSPGAVPSMPMVFAPAVTARTRNGKAFLIRAAATPESAEEFQTLMSDVGANVVAVVFLVCCACPP